VSEEVDLTGVETKRLLDELVSRGVLQVDTSYEHRFIRTEDDLLREGPGQHVGALMTRHYSGETRTVLRS
jgi:hypothetical protein